MSTFDIMKLAYRDLYITKDIVTFMIPTNSSVLLSLDNSRNPIVKLPQRSSILSKVAGLRPSNLLKNEFLHRRF